VQPFKRFLAIDLYGCRNSKGIVGADLLDEFPVAGRPGIGYNNEIEGPFLTPMSLESDLYSHKK
jgi:hypothetical protein